SATIVSATTPHQSPHVVATLVPAGQGTGPQRCCRCITGSNDLPPSFDSPISKPSTSSAHAYRPALVQVRHLTRTAETFEKESAEADALRIPSFGPPTTTVAPSGESAKPSRSPCA